MNKLILSLFLLCCCFVVSAQKDSLTIENKTVIRLFYFFKDSAGFYTKSFINKKTNQNYVNPATEEFSITVNDSVIEGNDCKYIRHSFSRHDNIQTLSVVLQTPFPKVYIQLDYELYEDLPIVRKRLNVINEGNRELIMTNLDVEKLRFQVVNKFDNEIYTSFGTNINRIPYKGDYNDAAILLYNLAAQEGAVIGNEAPSVLKNTEIYTQIHGCIQVGMRHIQEAFPFKKWLRPGETFRSPRTFIYVFQSPRWQDGFENQYKEFVRKYLGVSLFTHKKTPLVFYSTWIPFLDNINAKLIRDCVENLADIGTGLFIIDAGWYKYSGDFIPDSSKFPNGIKSIGDYIHKKGMKLGLWFTVGTVNTKSNIASQHPEWLIRDKNGLPANLHNMSPPIDGSGWSNNLANISLGTPYYDHFKNIVVNYIKELDISYVKFDLSIVASAYVHDVERTGDYDANSSKLYRDRASSYWIIYERIMQLMDDLHQQFPDILIDCTFETWGRYNTVDYALIQHADYDWLTNFEQKPPAGPISIRQMNFDRSRVIPASTLLIGNQSMNFPDYQYVYFSLASSSIVMVGDPRKLQPTQKSFYLKWNNYFKKLEDKYQYSHYFQLYDVFDRPTNSNWDGCYRINTEKMGGLLFFFRNNSSDVQRTFKIPCLDSNFHYKIYSYQENKVLGIYSGKYLIEKGVKVTIPTIYSALVLTIEKI